MNTVDARGYSCPEPVLMTKRALDKSGAPITVLVDSQTPLQNVTRYATNAGFKVSSKEVDGDFQLTIE